MVGRDLHDVYGERRGVPGRDRAVGARAHPKRRHRGHRPSMFARARSSGIAGLAGSGRTEVLRAVHGADPIDAGTHGGARQRGSDPIASRCHRARRRAPDRGSQGRRPPAPADAWPSTSTIARLDDIERWGVLRPVRERSVVRSYIDRLSIRTPSSDTRVRNLSGGNQQKVIFAKWLNAECRILLIDEPTRGVDVGAKREIYLLLRSLAERRGRDRHGLVGAAGDPRHERPHPRHA